MYIYIYLYMYIHLYTYRHRQYLRLGQCLIVSICSTSICFFIARLKKWTNSQVYIATRLSIGRQSADVYRYTSCQKFMSCLHTASICLNVMQVRHVYKFGLKLFTPDMLDTRTRYTRVQHACSWFSRGVVTVCWWGKQSLKCTRLQGQKIDGYDRTIEV